MERGLDGLLPPAAPPREPTAADQDENGPWLVLSFLTLASPLAASIALFPRLTLVTLARGVWDCGLWGKPSGHDSWRKWWSPCEEPV